MPKLFNTAQIETINQVAAKTKEAFAAPPSANAHTNNSELQALMDAVKQYFGDSSECTLVTSKDQLREYIDLVIEDGIAGLDTETTGLDRIHDYIVGVSIYSISVPPFYIPIKHLIPIFDEPYKDQFTYEEVREELQRLVDNKTKLVFANADFDLAMVYKDIKVDLLDVCYFDVLLAWRCLKENEPKNDLKTLYCKYVKKGKADPKKFSDFFTPSLFPYCKPEVAALYAANDAKITLELYEFELPYVTKSDPKCKAHKLEGIADLVWNIEFPMIRVCQEMHRSGAFIDKRMSSVLIPKYQKKMDQEMEVLADMVQNVLNTSEYSLVYKSPFKSGKDFNPKSTLQVKYLLGTLMKLPQLEKGKTGKDVIKDINLPITNQILKVRSLGVLISTFVEKLPKATTSDSRIHATFRSTGADCVTGDTVIPTKEGYFTIKELSHGADASEGNHIAIPVTSVIDMNQSWDSADSAIAFHNTPTIKVTTEFGFVLEGTPNHPIMVVDNAKNADEDDDFWSTRKFKCLSDVKIGDTVQIPCNYSIEGKYIKTKFVLGAVYNNRNAQATMPSVYDENFAEFLGMYHADGSAYVREGTYTISLSNDDPDVMSRFDELSLALFNVKTCRYNKQASKHEIETYINCMRLKDIDSILSHGKLNKKVPDAIWISPVSVINAYIRGMTLDSSVYFEKNSKRVQMELSVMDKEDARKIQIHLASQGILCGWGHNENKNSVSPRLKFNADNYLRFVKQIGFIESRKVVSTLPCLRNTYSWRRRGDSFQVRVKSIEHSMNDVYDFCVPQTHSFVSNGIISHNTGRMSSADPNLQNIPSHATDIRQMFRATPEMQKYENCMFDPMDNIIQVTIPRFYTVLTSEGNKLAESLASEDKVNLLKGKDYVVCKVVSCTPNVSDCGKVDIQFQEVEHE